MALHQYKFAKRKVVKSKMRKVTIRNNDIMVNQKENKDLAKYQQPWDFPLKLTNIFHHMVARQAI